MSPEQIKQLRSAINCTVRELAQVLGIDPSVVQGWENGEFFPTKRALKQLFRLRNDGVQAVLRTQVAPTEATVTGLTRLADPELWRVVRKLITYPELFAQVVAMSESYEDPTLPTPGV